MALASTDDTPSGRVWPNTAPLGRPVVSPAWVMVVRGSPVASAPVCSFSICSPVAVVIWPLASALGSVEVVKVLAPPVPMLT